MLTHPLPRELYWELSQGERLRCPECGCVVIEFMSEPHCDMVVYNCTSYTCDWRKLVDLREEANE